MMILLKEEDEEVDERISKFLKFSFYKKDLLRIT
jgi:hypothetical protein